MKKIILFFLITFTLSVFGQEEIEFKITYLPNHQYTFSQKQYTENIATIIASEEILEDLKSNGLENPQITRNTILIKSISRTGALTDEVIPFEIEVLESKGTLETGIKFLATATGPKVTIDSILSPTMTEEEKETLMASMESIMRQIEYPDRKIKVGESFQLKNPLSIPIGEKIIEMEITSVYTLTKVHNGIANFNLQELYTLKTEIKDHPVKADGNSNGHVEYDIEKQFFKSYFCDIDINMEMDFDYFLIELQGKIKFEQNTEILEIGQ